MVKAVDPLLHLPTSLVRRVKMLCFNQKRVQLPPDIYSHQISFKLQIYYRPQLIRQGDWEWIAIKGVCMAG